MSSGTDFKEGEFQNLENGEYLVRMNRITEKVTKKGDKMLSVGYQVMKKVGDEENESKSKNRLIFENFIIEHANPKVTEITQDRLGKYLNSVGVDNGLEGIGHDYSKLWDYLELPFKAKVGIQKGNNGYKDTNKIVAFSKR
jgi:hypothetical protein